MSSSYSLKHVKRVEVSGALSEVPGIRLCVTGGRDFGDLGFVWSNLDPYLSSLFGPVMEIGFGCARGVDALALRWAINHHIPWRRYVADWDTFDKEAGTLRNGAMLDDFRPDLLLVFPGGSGTRNCAFQAKEKGIERDFLLLDPFTEAQRWG